MRERTFEAHGLERGALDRKREAQFLADAEDRTQRLRITAEAGGGDADDDVSAGVDLDLRQRRAQGVGGGVLVASDNEPVAADGDEDGVVGNDPAHDRQLLFVVGHGGFARALIEQKATALHGRCQRRHRRCQRRRRLRHNECGRATGPRKPREPHRLGEQTLSHHVAQQALAKLRQAEVFVARSKKRPPAAEEAPAQRRRRHALEPGVLGQQRAQCLRRRHVDPCRWQLDLHDAERFFGVVGGDQRPTIGSDGDGGGVDDDVIAFGWIAQQGDRGDDDDDHAADSGDNQRLARRQTGRRNGTAAGRGIGCSAHRVHSAKRKKPRKKGLSTSGRQPLGASFSRERKRPWRTPGSGSPRAGWPGW